MPITRSHEIPEVARIALASASRADRDVWHSLFAFDARLGRIVTHAREPLLAQMRIAWWRDEIRKPIGGRVIGDPTLDELGRYWDGEEAAVLELADGWEGLLGEDPLGPSAFRAFARGRGAACAAVARLIGCEGDADAARDAGELWALAEIAARIADESERQSALDFGRRNSYQPIRRRNLRPLAVLSALSRRALARGGAPLIGDRLSPLVAFRLGILGR